MPKPNRTNVSPNTCEAPAPCSAGGFCVNSGLAGLAQRGLANPRADVAELGMEGTQAEQEAGDEAEGIVLWQSI